MPKINQEEYEILKELDDKWKWKWIARDNKGYGTKLKAHTSRPDKMIDSHWSNGDMTLQLLGGEHLFQFIKWEDEEPYNIAELIREYEWAQLNEKYPPVRESEETEVKKDMNWFKEEVNKILRDKVSDGINYYDYMDLKNSFNELISQLDDPEVLSSDWISKNVEYAYFDMLDGSGRLSSATAIIKPEKLKNLLVPKQEKVDRAYKDGYEKGKEHATEKQSEETETVAGVFVDYLIASAKLKLVLKMEVEELEE